jgi:nucleotide-binding universal stress UspA family protein
VTEIKRLLCPVDFSDASRHAVEHAVVIARWHRSRITALHVHNPLVLGGTDLETMDGLQGMASEAAEREQLPAQVAAYFESATALGIGVDVRIESGPPAARILDRAAELQADLIVMGTHGAGGFEHLVLGSVTEKVLRKAACPVLTVPPRAQKTSTLPFRRLLCPVDFSDPSLAALEFAFSMAEESDGEMIILHVLEWPSEDEPIVTRPFSAPEYHRLREEDATKRLEMLVPSEVRTWCRPVTRLGHGKAYREILGVAAEEGVDLIVMGVHGRNALDLMLFGSTTNQVVRRATCPVLTLRC